MLGGGYAATDGCAAAPALPRLEARQALRIEPLSIAVMDSTTRIEISRPGTFTAVDGTKVTFTDADMAAAAEAFDPASEPAPLVIGHPMLDAPAYGWVGSLSVAPNGKLVATPKDVLPAFAEVVKAGRYKRVSASWYPPGHPQNPKPSAWYLKHVGFLGGAAPAIRGLEPIHFSEAQLEGAVTIDLEPQEPTMAEETDRTAEFAERETTITTRETELAERETAIAERERLAEETAATARHAANVSFAEGLSAAGKLAPAGKALVVGLMDTIASMAVVSFGEANGELAPIEAFKKLFEGAQPIVSFSELAPGGDTDVSVVSFAAPAGYTVEPASLELHGKALAYQASHDGVGYLDAVKAVS